MATIRDRARAKQLIQFNQMEWGKKGMSDIDAVLDWQGKFFVFIEVKYNSAPLTTGQRILLENICKSMKVPCVGIHANHDIANTETDIALYSCGVKEVFYNGTWAKPKVTVKVKELMNKLLKREGLIDDEA